MILTAYFADFSSAACLVHGRLGYQVKEWDFFKNWRMTPEVFWNTIHEYGDEFYEKLVQPYRWSTYLLRKIALTDDFALVSAPTRHPSSYSGKKIWVDKYLQPHLNQRIKLIVTGEKHLLATPDRLLIDDNDQNIKKFQAAGGRVITFPQIWNSQEHHVLNRIPFVFNGINYWKGETNVER